jgi:hypothetical protein
MRMSQVWERWRLLGFYGRRKVSRRNLADKSLSFVRPVAERRICGVPTAAETHTGTPTKAKGLSCLIDDLEIPFHAQRTIVVYGYLCSSQEFLQDFEKTLRTEKTISLQITALQHYKDSPL